MRAVLSIAALLGMSLACGNAPIAGAQAAEMASAPVFVAFEPGNKGTSDEARNRDDTDVDIDIGIVFGSDERRIIRDYFEVHSIEVQGLPPGIAKNLARGKPLPPGIAKKFLPYDLSSQLPYRDGYERLIVGRDILLIEIATGVVFDILRDVF